jgi:hypothetical protein
VLGNQTLGNVGQHELRRRHHSPGASSVVKRRIRHFPVRGDVSLMRAVQRAKLVY